MLACGCCVWRGQQRAAAEAAERKRVADEQVAGALQSLCVPFSLCVIHEAVGVSGADPWVMFFVAGACLRDVVVVVFVVVVFVVV